MPDSFARVVLHTTFSTKYRSQTITPELEDPVKRLLTYHLRQLNSAVIEINCLSDHVHIIHTLPRTITIAKLIQEAKKWTSRSINDDYPGEDKLSWQTGYATFSCNYLNLNPVIHYVRNQKIHHGYTDLKPVESFMEEYTRQLLRHGFEIHPKFLFPVAPRDQPH